MISEKLHHIIVIGGGAGGIELVTRLGKKLGKNNQAKITLIDKQEIHIWKPLLHEVAAGSLDSNVDQLNFYSHAAIHNYYYQPGELKGINRKNKTISLSPILGEDNNLLVPERTLSYDTLVIAIGSQSNDFNTPGVKEYCFAIDNLEQANIFHKKYIEQLLAIEYAPENLQKSLNIVIVGAGATGIELSAELRHTLQAASRYNFNNSIIQNATITVVEGGDRILPMLPAPISQSIAEKLKKLNINLLTNEVAIKMEKYGLYTKSEKFIPADLCIWAAGVKAPVLLASLDNLEVDKINRLLVNENLQTTLDENIFAFGDCANIPDTISGRPVPPRAQAAHQAAKFLTQNLINRIKNKPLKKFQFYDKGSLVALSCFGAYGDITGFGKMRYFIGGKVAQLAYRSLHFMHLSVLYGASCAFLLKIAKHMLSRTHTKLNLHFSKH